MEFVEVRLEMPANTPIMMLREVEGRRRLLPIAIGNPEAAAIHYAVEGIEPPRPLTHDLLTIVLSELDAVLEQVTVTALLDRTFYASLSLVTAAGTKLVSCRPSDGIALAVRVKCPIFASDDVLDDAAVDPDDDETIISDFQSFIDNVSPDDFA